MLFCAHNLRGLLISFFALSNLYASSFEKDDTDNTPNYHGCLSCEINNPCSLSLPKDHPFFLAITDEKLQEQLTALPLKPLVADLTLAQGENLIQALIQIRDNSVRTHVVKLLQKDELRLVYKEYLPALVTFLSGIDVSIKRIIAAYLAEKSLEQAICFVQGQHFPSSDFSRPLKIYGPKEHGW
ncbi:MAG: hypothetical protein ACK5YY_03425 [Alphaproteobacteria bacterium]|jgi:hypothetical protein|nr:hypothetical protein [Alphaproteobacteria bacterium]